MIKAVVFDFDGVIVDTEVLNSKAYEEVLREYGKTPVVKRGETVHAAGVKGQKNWELLKKKYNIDEDITVLYKKKVDIYSALLPQAKLIPGFRAALKRLQKHEFLSLAVATMSPRTVVNFILDKFKISNAFNIVLTLEDCDVPKPHPDIYLKTAEKLNLPPRQCVVIEDSETGIEAAKNAGMFVIAIANKYSKSHNFSRADEIVNDFSKITDALLRSF